MTGRRARPGRRPVSYLEHLERTASRRLHVAHVALRAGDVVLALEALQLAAADLLGVAAIRWGWT